jgi:predicted 3-demethylubiquinone-9 3-methyltransferase (glyoxalase superfamily)
MATVQKITPCLWFDSEAEEAAKFYVDIFPNSKITQVSRYQEDTFGKPAGSVLTVVFELAGQQFTALNGGPFFKFNEAISLQIMCDDQKEVDHFWEKLGAGGDPQAQQCGWLKDKFGLSWQVVPKRLIEMITSKEADKALRATQAMMQMKKFDVAALEKAYSG